MTKQRTLILLATLAAILLLTTGWLVLQRANAGDALAQCRKSTVSGGMESFGVPFTLTDQSGTEVSDAQVFSKPSLLYFGYTFCPDVCPLDTARNASAIDILNDEGFDAHQVFITVDPTRDTPEVVKDFADAISPEMVGLTGTKEQIDAVSKGWRNYYKLNDQDDKEFYLVDHMTHTYLVLPEQGTVEFFSRDIPAEEIAERTACFIDATS